MTRKNLGAIRGKLLRWYGKRRRDLPWRTTRDPYSIWVAETMLQQTQVNTVLPYYLRFLKALPTLRALDRAPMERVLTLWSGLGYYRRAENLKKAARIVVHEHRGKLPRDLDQLRALPGVGAYTAGALMSIAFDRPYPAVDGNAQRVLQRLFNAESEKDIHDFARRLVSRRRPGKFNQALMELGSRVCLSRNPRCALCPISNFCAAYRSPRQLSPSVKARRKITQVDWPLLFIQRGGKVLLRRRPSGGLLGGLWEIPGGERKRGESLHKALRRQLDGLTKGINPVSLLGEISHSITDRKIRAPLFKASMGKGIRLPLSNWRWVSSASLYRYPLSSLTRKALRLAVEP